MANSDKGKQLPPTPVHYFKKDGTPVSCLRFLTLQRKALLAQGSQDGNLIIWDLETCKQKYYVQAHESPCQAVLQLDEGQVLTQGRNDSICIWDLDLSKPVSTFPFSHHGFCKAAQVRDLVACPAEPPSAITLLDPRSGREEGRLSAPSELGTVMQLCPLPDDTRSRLVAVYESGGLLLWEPGAARPSARLQLTSDTPMCVDVAADGRGLVGTSGSGVPTFTVTADGLAAGPSLELTNPGVASVRVRRDGRVAALGCWDHRLRVVSWRKLRLLAALEHHGKTVECVEFAPAPVRLWKANSLLASGGADGTVALWKIYDDV